MTSVHQHCADPADAGLPATPVARLEAANARDLAELRRLQLALGGRLLELRARGAYRTGGCNSFRHYLERQGFGVVEGRLLLRMAEAATLDRRVPAATEAGRIPARSADALAQVLAAEARAAQEAPGETASPAAAPSDGAPAEVSSVDWVKEAERIPTEEFRDLVTERLAWLGDDRHAPGWAAGLSRITFYTDPDHARCWRRVRRLVARSLQREVWEGDVLGIVARDYLTRHDPRYRRAQRLRQTKARGERPRTRHVPVAVQQEVIERDGDRCCVPLCPDSAFLDFAHLYVRHADGGAATASNLARMCHGHNLMQEAGLLTVHAHPSGPIFVDAHGRVLERSRDPSGPRLRLAEFLAMLSGADPPAGRPA
jgi:hypothetical protein